MTDAVANQPIPAQPAPSAAPSTCPGATRQRDPPIFSGSGEQDVEDWLSLYERVSASNKWDNDSKLAYVIFYLADVAKLWFTNRETAIASWSTFKTLVTEAFGRPEVRKLRADQRLRHRAQQPGETFTSYIEDVLDLCKRVNSSMPEEEKIRHILKGIEDGAFQMLLAKSPTTIAALVSLCQSFDELRRQRSIARQSVPSPDSISAVALANGNVHQGTLSNQIKDFIREEVARQLSLLPHSDAPTTSLPSNMQQAIRTEICNALPTVPASYPCTSVPSDLSTAGYAPTAPPSPLSYAAVVARPPPHPVALSAPPPPASPPVYRPPPCFFRPSNEWRTRDNRPICFACGIAGHIARFCRRRPTPAHAYFGAPTYAPQQTTTSRYEQRHSDSDHHPSTARFSSPRRRSPSPMRRRPPPEEGN
ncbi:uncharacterized protein LOC142795730 [Rhipicephalus microplus]|uniref:uncharacterized protein LOC142795730 n=1 Tax=Rhipicephalus microplus TaxID=6941 RepID=UPI003F6AE18E